MPSDPLAFDRDLQEYTRACRNALAPGADPGWEAYARRLAWDFTEGPRGATARELLRRARGDTPFRASLPLLDDALAYLEIFEAAHAPPSTSTPTFNDAIRQSIEQRRTGTLTREEYLDRTRSRLSRVRSRAVDRATEDYRGAIQAHLGNDWLADLRVLTRVSFPRRRHRSITGEFARASARERMASARGRAAAEIAVGFAHGLDVDDLSAAAPESRPHRIAANLRLALANLVQLRHELGLPASAGLSEPLRHLATTSRGLER